MTGSNLGATVDNITRFGANADLVLRAVEHRAALATVELEEVRDRVQTSLAVGVMSSVALLLAGVTATVVVAALFWDTPYRVLALSVLAGLELLAAAGGAWYLRSRWSHWTPLEHTRDQLSKDSECLREILTRNGR